MARKNIPQIDALVQRTFAQKMWDNGFHPYKDHTGVAAPSSTRTDGQAVCCFSRRSTVLWPPPPCFSFPI